MKGKRRLFDRYVFQRTTSGMEEDELIGRKQLLVPENNSTNIAQSQYIPLAETADLGISWAIVDAGAVTTSLVRQRYGFACALRCEMERAGPCYS